MEINIQNVSMTYPSGKQALQNLSLELRSPSLIGLLGPNGAGKSTLMKLLVAALLPTSGSILVDGQPLLKTERQLKAQLGYLPQDFGLFNELTVAQFLDYMAALKGLRDSGTAVREVIRTVNLEGQARARIRSLSGGQRQRPFYCLTNPRWAWTRRSASTSATCSPARPRTGWYCCPPTLSRTCSRCVTGWWSSTTGKSCSPARRSS